MKKISFVFISILLFWGCSKKYLDVRNDVIEGWINYYSGSIEECDIHKTYCELFGEDTGIRKHQSMAIANGYVFCFNSGNGNIVYDFSNFDVQFSYLLPEESHHNNAQFLDYYLDSDDFPLLLLSQGDSPPRKNDACYVVRINKNSDGFSYSVLTTISNSILEACNNGSWVADYKNKRLYLYTLTKGDYRVRRENTFCIYEFYLPDYKSKSVFSLSREDILNVWELPFVILQSCVSINGYLLFNLEDCLSLELPYLNTNKCLAVFNPRTGIIESYLPLKESMETEGMSFYNNKLYVSFKDGHSNQPSNSVVFKINEYSLPSILNSN